MKTTRILGIAFIFQFFTSLIGNAVFKARVIFPEDFEKTLIALKGDNISILVYIALSIGTTLGVIFLGYMLYKNLKYLNKNAASLAFIFYVIEGISLLISLGYSYKLLQLANSYTTISNINRIGFEYLTNAEIFSGNIHMLLFCLGAFIFYFYLIKSNIINKLISLWGFICVPFIFIFTILSFFSIEIPFMFYLPYVPFEFVIGIVLIIKKNNLTTASS